VSQVEGGFEKARKSFVRYFLSFRLSISSADSTHFSGAANAILVIHDLNDADGVLGGLDVAPNPRIS
jgi:hypothetical protein